MSGAGFGGREPVDVAVGVLIDGRGRVLMGSRPEGKPCAGFWEFPGGKLEPGEDPERALRRELEEELGVEVLRSYPWFVRMMDYPHALVRLHFRRCWRWRGEPRGLEGQRFGFYERGRLPGGKLLPMDDVIAGWARLPLRAALLEGDANLPERARRALEAGARLLFLPGGEASGAELRLARGFLPADALLVTDRGGPFRGALCGRFEEAPSGADFVFAERGGEAGPAGCALPVLKPSGDFSQEALEAALEQGWHGLWRRF
ncbi:NUDIX domain-containing protein [Mesosutterella sp. OilRF-GAM-744-9]|uniref:8-oxo-dGTP diphosphatase n=1 Tax=Mesosutterella porci TaxID=2915351 RepID=A0ABS9MRM4_9BURK|nr:NUDIX domain-containing protein [Mesosutterella sp. oilRF-744-WT-GAM-9]MCG5031269.1 NUDIX domain-containing protein [Mesosutterella sp. oilRF-744-WT-GAM-9]